MHEVASPSPIFHHHVHHHVHVHPPFFSFSISYPSINMSQTPIMYTRQNINRRCFGFGFWFQSRNFRCLPIKITHPSNDRRGDLIPVRESGESSVTCTSYVLIIDLSTDLLSPTTAEFRPRYRSKTC